MLEQLKKALDAAKAKADAEPKKRAARS